MKTHLIILENEKETSEIKETIKALAGGDRVILLMASEHFPDLGDCGNKVELANINDFLTAKDLEKIDTESAFFARNWHKFNKEFEKKSTFNGISLGSLSENELFIFLRNCFSLTKAITAAIKKRGLHSITANKNSVSGKAVAAIAKSTGFTEINLFKCGRGKKFSHFTNFTKKKIFEFKKKTPHLMRSFFSKKTPGKKNIFIRSRHYLGDLENELRKEESFSVFSLDNFLAKSILNPKTMLEYFSIRDSMRRSFVKEFSVIKNSQEFKKRLCFEKIEFFEMLAPKLDQLAERDWPEFIFLIKSLSRLFEKSKPDSIVLWVDALPYERICTILAKRAGAKSIVIQHGVFQPTTKKGDWINGFAPVTADFIAVWGERFKKALIEKGVAQSRIRVTGSPRMEWITKRKFNPEKTRAELGIKNGERLLLFLPNAETKNEAITKIIKGTRDIPHSRLVIKPHHADEPKRFKCIAGKNAVVTSCVNVYELINAAESVIMQNSTVGLEAMLLGKPVIKFGRLTLHDIYSNGTVLKAKDAETLKKTVELAADEKKRERLAKNAKKLLFETNYRQDGKSCQRIISLIKSSIKK